MRTSLLELCRCASLPCSPSFLFYFKVKIRNCSLRVSTSDPELMVLCTGSKNKGFCCELDHRVWSWLVSDHTITCLQAVKWTCPVDLEPPPLDVHSNSILPLSRIKLPDSFSNCLIRASPPGPKTGWPFFRSCEQVPHPAPKTGWPFFRSCEQVPHPAPKQDDLSSDLVNRCPTRPQNRMNFLLQPQKMGAWPQKSCYFQAACMPP